MFYFHLRVSRLFVSVSAHANGGGYEDSCKKMNGKKKGGITTQEWMKMVYSESGWWRFMHGRTGSKRGTGHTFIAIRRWRDGRHQVPSRVMNGKSGSQVSCKGKVEVRRA